MAYKGCAHLDDEPVPRVAPHNEDQEKLKHIVSRLAQTVKLTTKTIQSALSKDSRCFLGRFELLTVNPGNSEQCTFSFSTNL